MTLESLGIASIHNQLQNFTDLSNQYKQDLAALDTNLENCNEQLFKMKSKNVEDLNKLIANLKKQVATYLNSTYKNLNKLKQAELAAQIAKERALWQQIKTLSDSDKLHSSDEDKIIFLRYECAEYSKHLHGLFHDPIREQKHHLLNNYLTILNQESKSATLKLQEFTVSFTKPENIQLLATARDSKFVSFLKAVVSTILPKNYLYKVKGFEFMQHIRPVLGNNFSLFSTTKPPQSAEGIERPLRKSL